MWRAAGVSGRREEAEMKDIVWVDRPVDDAEGLPAPEEAP